VLTYTWRWQSEILAFTEVGTTGLKAALQASRMAAFNQRAARWRVLSVSNLLGLLDRFILDRRPKAK